MRTPLPTMRSLGDNIMYVIVCTYSSSKVEHPHILGTLLKPQSEAVLDQPTHFPSFWQWRSTDEQQTEGTRPQMQACLPVSCHCFLAFLVKSAVAKEGFLKDASKRVQLTFPR